jgi:hypothetical protein
MMNRNKSTSLVACLLLLSSTILLCGCRSSKSLTTELRKYHSNLSYDLEPNKYYGELLDNVYLDFIDYSNMDYDTSAKKKGQLILPLIIFNYSKQNYEVTLGESSITPTYREFLTKSLLSESNNSTCYNLYDIEKFDSTKISPSAYRLRVKIIFNETIAKYSEYETSIMWFPSDDDSSFDYLDLPSNRSKNVESMLELDVTLSQGGKERYRHTFYVDYMLPKDSKSGNCVDMMTKSLSLATKQAVGEVTQALHLFFIARDKK